MDLEITGKRKKDQPTKSWKKCKKIEFERCGLRREYVYNREKSQGQIKAKIFNPGRLGNGNLLYVPCMQKVSFKIM